MVHWDDPKVIALQAQGFQRLVHFLCGVFCYNFGQSLPYDWSIYTRQRPWRWTTSLYLLVRWSSLALVLCFLVGINLNDVVRIDCKRWITITFAFGYTTVIGVTSLLAVRITMEISHLGGHTAGCSVAHANYLCLLWQVFVSFPDVFLANGRNIGIITAKRDAFYEPSYGSCMLRHTDNNRINLLVIAVTHFTLLFGLMAGVRNTKNPGKLWELVWQQGIICTAIPAFTMIPLVILTFLNLNDVMNLMFLPASMICLAIGSTRVYRGLSEFCLPLHDSVQTITRIQFAPPSKVRSMSASTVRPPLPTLDTSVVRMNVLHSERSLSCKGSTLVDEDTIGEGKSPVDPFAKDTWDSPTSPSSPTH
ncbi:hypothetical protein PUNSTDRAFT_137109 [Punctularia strigosozonata HHB-11173 SS5]|uniref:uncharacterized protein n=1 Tax=Punctularia strigosozonata (strain HHB-11173) TaxID=741275 RepID=UPI00044178E2|nr:uncharacterized protein PUNSTDRAFT_137109 [Punctularia strigosozonata HHB-11173 SS5]EIN06333.1 hypothetical protein PUNSTDRAFT_137109 [Punctularia strigosozonata HHB-11173 SS5]